MLHLNRAELTRLMSNEITLTLGGPLMVSTVLNMHQSWKKYTIKAPYSSALVKPLVYTQILYTIVAIRATMGKQITVFTIKHPKKQIALDQPSTKEPAERHT